MIISFSHNDLDALGCELCIKNKFKDSEIYYVNTNYKNIQEKTQRVIELIPTCSAVFITDICFNEHINHLLSIKNVSELYSVPVFYIDHHEYSSDFLEIDFGFKYFKIDKSKSAAVLTAEFLKVPESLMNLCLKIQAFDIWQSESKYFKDGVCLNAYYWVKFMSCGYEPNKIHRFFYPELCSDFNSIVANQFKESEVYFNNNKDMIQIKDKIAVAILDEHYIPLQLKLFKQGVKILIIITTYDKVMVRIDKSFSEFAPKIKKVFLDDERGHSLAFSIDISFASMKEVAEFIKVKTERIEEIIC